MRLNDPLFPKLSAETDPSLTDTLLGVAGGLVKVMTLQQIKNTIGVTVEDDLTSESTVNAASVNQVNIVSEAVALKLDASLYNNYYKGTYATLGQLQTAHATADLGDYAIVDAGAGQEASMYIWDAQDGWIQGTNVSIATTDALAEGSTNFYFTNSRAIAAVGAAVASAVSTGLTPTVNTQIGTAYTVGTFITDNDGKTYLRMDNASDNTVTIPSLQTLPISVRQANVGVTTLAAGAGVTLMGVLVFTAQHQTKTIIPLGGGIYDVVG